MVPNHSLGKSVLRTSDWANDADPAMELLSIHLEGASPRKWLKTTRLSRLVSRRSPIVHLCSERYPFSISTRGSQFSCASSFRESSGVSFGVFCPRRWTIALSKTRTSVRVHFLLKTQRSKRITVSPASAERRGYGRCECLYQRSSRGC